MPPTQHKYRQNSNHSMGSGRPRFGATNSSFRLSRTSTNTNPNYSDAYYDNQSLRTIDQIPAAKSSVTYLDKLWTQIDVLDDVRDMSDQVREKGSFFNDKFNEELNKLKQSQEKLIEAMVNQQTKNVATFERHKQSIRRESKHLETGNTEDGDTARKKQDKYTDFFKKKGSSNMIYKKQNFDDMNGYVKEVKQNLEAVGESMKNFEDTTRDLW